MKMGSLVPPGSPPLLLDDGPCDTCSTNASPKTTTRSRFDWRGVFESRLERAFEKVATLAPLIREFPNGTVAEWEAIPQVLLRLREGMRRMAAYEEQEPHSSSNGASITEQAQKQAQGVMVAAEEAVLMSEKLLELVRAINPVQFQCYSTRRRQDIQLLMDCLYRTIKFLYLRWLSDLPGYIEFCQHRAIHKACEEDEISTEDDEKLLEEENGYDSVSWKALEDAEGNVSEFLSPISNEAAWFWVTEFKEPLRFMVKWEDFEQAIITHLGYTPSQIEMNRLANLLDPARSQMVSVFRFREFLKGFSPFRECLLKFKDLVSHDWHHGYMSHYEAERLLEAEPPGTFLVRHRDLLPGSLAIALAHSTVPDSSSALHIMIFSYGEAVVRQKELGTTPKGSLKFGGFSVEQEGQLWHFGSVPELVAHFKRILVRPFTSRLLMEPWFYSDLSSEETTHKLSNQHSGTFLIRFSGRSRNCLAVTYVGDDGKILHSVVEKVVLPGTHQRVFRQRLDNIPKGTLIPTFSGVNELIEAYQSVLAFPFVDANSIVLKIEEEANKVVEELASRRANNRSGEQSLWRRSSVINTSGTSGSGVLVGGKRLLVSRNWRDTGGRDKKIFGCNLVAYVEMQRQRDSWLDLEIPLFAEQLIRYLYMHVKEEGLFRAADSSADAKHLIEKLNRGIEVDVFAINKPHLISTLLKSYLRELEEPLLTNKLYSKFILINSSMPLTHVVELLHQLPKEHIALLKYLLKLLHQISNESSAKMTAHNLAVCVGPNILRRSGNTSLEASLEAAYSVYAVCTLLIDKALVLFPELETLSLKFIEGDNFTLMSSRRQIKSASTEMLIHMIHTCPPGLIPAAYNNYIGALLLTYHSWTTASELLNNLIQIYKNLSMQPEQNKLAIMRIFAFLKKWTREQFYEFQEDPQLLETYEQFVLGQDVQVMRALAPTLSKMKASKGEVKLMFSEPAPKPQIPNKRPLSSILHVSPIELARQMTLIEFDILSKIKPIELVEKAWMTDNFKRAPNVMALTSHFNQVHLLRV